MARSAIIVACMIALAAAAAVAPRRTVMPWLCLERCGNTTAAEVDAHIATLVEHRDVISVVSFEHLNLGPNSTLVVDTNLSPVAARLKAANFTTISMVSSFPYPPQFLDWMRQVFANPLPFLNALVQQLVAENIDGVNIDWEPTKRATEQDAHDYAAFLRLLRTTLGFYNKTVSADIATWNSIWNLTALHAALADPVGPKLPQAYVATMNTYAYPDALFHTEAVTVANVFPPEMLVMGIETWTPYKPNYGAANVTYRFRVMEALGVRHAAIWRVPLEPFYWDILRAFVNGTIGRA